MKKLSLKLKLEKETKNTFRFEEVETDYVGYLYIQKSAFDGKAPETLEVDVNYDETKTGKCTDGGGV